MEAGEQCQFCGNDYDPMHPCRCDREMEQPTQFTCYHCWESFDASMKSPVKRETMRDAVASETPEQKARFYLEVAALLGNTSAADRLREIDGR